LDLQHRRNLIRWIERHFTSLRFAAEDIWQETLQAMWKIVSERPQGLKESGSLSSLLKKIANRRAAMRLRRRLGPEELPEPSLVADTAENGDLVEFLELGEMILHAVRRFSRRLRLVWYVYLGHIADLGSFEDLRQAVLCQTGVLLTRKTVIRRIQRGREKLREALRRHYHSH
jgi:DNA-directed RNA polymerase specialized sigma24 family protein